MENRNRGTSLVLSLWWELVSQCLVVEAWLLGHGWAKSKKITGNHPHVHSPLAGRSVKVRCCPCKVAGEGGSLAMLTVA